MPTGRMPHVLTRREIKMITLLNEALREIQHELDAAGPEEVRQHPTYQAKARFITRAQNQITRWEMGGQ